MVFEAWINQNVNTTWKYYINKCVLKIINLITLIEILNNIIYYSLNNIIKIYECWPESNGYNLYGFFDGDLEYY